MELKTVGAIAAVLLITRGAAESQSNPSAPPTLVVRSYNNFGVPTEDLLIARARAAAILRDAGIEVTWMDCWFRDREPADASQRCRRPPDGHDLILRLQAGKAAAGTKYVSMGFSLVIPGQEAAFLSTVYLNSVQTVARGAEIDSHNLLGLAIAHEIGHLLLNTNGHAAAGLMRADWSRAELRRDQVSDWRFLETEAATIRAAALSRGAHDGAK